MNKRQQAGMRKAFQAAKLHLSHGSSIPDIYDYNFSKYICNALATAEWHGFITWKQKNDAKNLLDTRLGGYHSIESWLGVNVEGFAEMANDKKITTRMIQDYRRRWLDSLIEEFT